MPLPFGYCDRSCVVYPSGYDHYRKPLIVLEDKFQSRFAAKENELFGKVGAVSKWFCI